MIETAQVVVEVLRSSSQPPLRTAQAAAEVARRSSTPRIRAAQAIAEILRMHDVASVPIVTAQVVADIVRTSTVPTVRVATVCMEVLRQYWATPEPLLEEEYTVEKCSADAQHVVLTLGLADSLRERFPRWRYSRTQCRWTSVLECPYATVCSKRLSECITRGRTEWFGAFPGIPGGIFDA